MKREPMSVYVNGERMCDTDSDHEGHYWKRNRHWYYHAEEAFGNWRILKSRGNMRYIKSLRTVLSKALAIYRVCCPSGYHNHPNPIIFIGNPPEEKC